MSRTLSSTSPPSAYTLIELLAVMLVIALTGIIEEFVAHRFDRGPGIGAAAVTLIVCVIVVGLVYRWSWRRERRQLQELREVSRGIYRVIALPECQSIID